VIDKVVKAFNPGSFSTTIFINSKVKFPPLLQGQVQGFRVMDAVVQNLGPWQLYFSHYAKNRERQSSK
jgi:hypothetical protein